MSCTCKRIRYDESVHQLHDAGCPELPPDPTPSPTPKGRTSVHYASGIDMVNAMPPEPRSLATTPGPGEDEERDQLTAERMMVDSMLTRLDEQEAELASLRLQVEEVERERERLAGELWEMAGDRARLIDALQRIAMEDYRGPRPHSIDIAAAALAPIEEDK